MSAMIMSDGPAANAEARKRGARIAAFQSGPRAQAAVEERRHRVDADRPDDRDEHERDVLLRDPASRRGTS